LFVSTVIIPELLKVRLGELFEHDFLQGGCSLCHPTNSREAMKAD